MISEATHQAKGKNVFFESPQCRTSSGLHLVRRPLFTLFGGGRGQLRSLDVRNSRAVHASRSGDPICSCFS
jgi:hypothetical protein